MNAHVVFQAEDIDDAIEIIAGHFRMVADGIDDYKSPWDAPSHVDIYQDDDDQDPGMAPSTPKQSGKSK
jgi:hypothetical protein